MVSIAAAFSEARRPTRIPLEWLAQAAGHVTAVNSRGLGLGGRIRNWFLTGVIVAGPLAITVCIVWYFVATIDDWVERLVPDEVWPDASLPFTLPGFGVVVAFLGLTLLDFLAANLFGRSLIGLSKAVLARMPTGRSISKSVKQIFEAVLSQSGTTFRRVGLIAFAAKGMWTLVFIAAPPADAIGEHLPAGEENVSVFLPCTPNPTTGFYIFRAARDVIEVSLSPDTAAKVIMSCGVIRPDAEAPPPGGVARKGRAGPDAADLIAWPVAESIRSCSETATEMPAGRPGQSAAPQDLA